MAPPSTDWNCRECRARVPSDFDACWRCGMTRDGVPDPDFVREVGVVLSGECHACGYELTGSDSTGTCPECGSRFDRRRKGP